MSNTFTSKVSGKMSSRGWAIALGIGAIVLAAILLVVYLDRYRAQANGENAPTPVLVAKRLIPKGTPGTLVASQLMYATTTVPRKEAQVGALSDPRYLVGRAASTDVFPGSQITTTDFSASASNLVQSQIVGPQRAISISIDNVHGSLGELQAGDFIDLYIALGARANGQQLVKLFRPNVKVLAVPTSAGGNLVLRINRASDASNFAFVADNTQMYFVLRPTVGATPTPPSTATISSLG